MDTAMRRPGRLPDLKGPGHVVLFGKVEDGLFVPGLEPAGISAAAALARIPEDGCMEDLVLCIARPPHITDGGYIVPQWTAQIGEWLFTFYRVSADQPLMRSVRMSPEGEASVGDWVGRHVIAEGTRHLYPGEHIHTVMAPGCLSVVDEGASVNVLGRGASIGLCMGRVEEMLPGSRIDRVGVSGSVGFMGRDSSVGCLHGVVQTASDGSSIEAVEMHGVVCRSGGCSMGKVEGTVHGGWFRREPDLKRGGVVVCEGGAPEERTVRVRT